MRHPDERVSYLTGEAGPTAVVNLAAIDPEADDVVRIDRGSCWANPYLVGRDGDRLGVIERYRGYIATRADLVARLDELRGKRLGCWCAPRPCHGSVLLDMLAAADLGPPLHSCVGPGCLVARCEGDGPRIDPVAEGWAGLLTTCDGCGHTTLWARCSTCRLLAEGWAQGVYLPPRRRLHPAAAAAL